MGVAHGETDEVEERNLFPSFLLYRQLFQRFHLIPPLRGDLPLKGKALQGFSTSIVPFYHKRRGRMGDAAQRQEVVPTDSQFLQAQRPRA